MCIEFADGDFTDAVRLIGDQDAEDEGEQAAEDDRVS